MEGEMRALPLPFDFENIEVGRKLLAPSPLCPPRGRGITRLNKRGNKAIKKALPEGRA